MCSFSGLGKLVKHKSPSSPSSILLLSRVLLLTTLLSRVMEFTDAAAAASPSSESVRRMISPGPLDESAGGTRGSPPPVRVLSPRSVEIKYGTLRGLLISLESNDSPNQQQHFPASLSLSSWPLAHASGNGDASATSSSSSYSPSSNPSSSGSSRRRRDGNDVTTNESTRIELTVPANTKRSMSSHASQEEGSWNGSTDVTLADSGSSTFRVNREKEEKLLADTRVNSQGSVLDQLNQGSKRWQSSPPPESATVQAHGNRSMDSISNDEIYNNNNGDDVMNGDMNQDHVPILQASVVSSSLTQSQGDAFNGNHKDSSHVVGSKGRPPLYALQVNDAPESAPLTASSSSSSASSSSQAIKGKIMGSKASSVSGAEPLPSSPSSSSGAAGGSVRHKVRGYVEVFRGIPYATPPVASLRFMPPMTPVYWKGTRLFTKFAAVCPQILPVLRPDDHDDDADAGHKVYDHEEQLPIPASLISSPSDPAAMSSSTDSAPTASPTDPSTSSRISDSLPTSSAPSTPVPIEASSSSSERSEEDDGDADNLIYSSLTSRTSLGSNLNFLQRSITGSASPAPDLVNDEDWRSGVDRMKNSVLLNLHQNVKLSPPLLEQEMEGMREQWVHHHAASIGEGGEQALRAKGRQASSSTFSSGLPESLKTMDDKEDQHHLHHGEEITNGDSMHDNESQRRGPKGRRWRRSGTSSANIRTTTKRTRAAASADDDDDDDARERNHHSSNPSSADQGLKSSHHHPEYIASILPFLQNQSEDCLYLNLYAPYPESALRGTGEHCLLFQPFVSQHLACLLSFSCCSCRFFFSFKLADS